MPPWRRTAPSSLPPTGAGKTIVGEFGIYLALRRGMESVLYDPIKALSNQKYHDFVRAYGEGITWVC